MKTKKDLQKNKQAFDSKAISLQQLEERKEMLVIWDSDKGFFPECRN